MSVLITTVYKGSAVIQAIKLFSPTKVLFLVDEPIDAIRENTLRMIKEFYPDISYEKIPSKIYDIVEIASNAMKTIGKHKEENKEEKIIVHISEGRKTMSLGLLYGAYMCRDKVSALYYIMEETNLPIQLPLLELNISPQKKKILQLISDGKKSIPELESELGTSTSTIYVQMKELRDLGFLNSNNDVTDIAKIALLEKLC